MPLPTCPAGQWTIISGNSFQDAQPRYPAGSGNFLGTIRGHSISDLASGGGAVYDTDQDEYIAPRPGGDSDGSNNGAQHFSTVATQLWTCPRLPTVNLIPLVHGAVSDIGRDGAAETQGTPRLAGSLAAGFTGPVALKDVSQFSDTGGQCYLTVSGDFTIANRETATYSTRNTGTKTITLTARGGNARALSTGDPVTPLQAGGGPLTVYTDTLGLYGPANGLWPCSVHQYGGLVYISPLKQVVSLGGSRWFEGAFDTNTWHYDSVAHTYALQASDPVQDALLGIYAVWDRTAFRVLYQGATGLWAYDPTGTPGTRYVKLGTSPSNGNQTHNVLHDPRRKRFVRVGRFSNAAGDAFGMSYFDMTGTPGAFALLDMPGNPIASLPTSFITPGLKYDPICDDYVYYPGFGNTVYYINPDTGAVTSESGLGGATMPTATVDVGSMFQYCESQNVFLVPNCASGASMNTGSMYAFRRSNQSRAVALPNGVIVQTPRWLQGAGPEGAPPPGGAGNDKLTQWTMDHTREKVITVGGNVAGQYATPPFFLGKQGDGNNEMWEGSPLTKIWTQIQSMTLTPATAGVVPDTPEDVAFAVDNVGGRSIGILMPGFFNSTQLAPRQPLTLAMTVAHPAVGEVIHVDPTFGFSYGGLVPSDLSGWPATGEVYIYPPNGVGGQQEVIGYSAIDRVNGLLTVSARAQHGTAAHDFPLNSRVCLNRAYGSYNPTGPVADLGIFEMDLTTRVDGWAPWQRSTAGFPPVFGGAGDNASVGTTDYRPNGSNSFYRLILSAGAAPVMQRLDRTILPGTWHEYQLGGGALGSLSVTIPSAGSPTVGQSIFVGATADDTVWPPVNGIIAIGAHNDSPAQAEYIRYASKNASNGSVVIAERGYRGSTPRAHAIGEEVWTAMMGFNGAICGQDRLDVDPAGPGFLYFVAHLGGNFCWSFDNAPHLMKFNLTTFTVSAVCPMPPAYVGDRVINFVAEQYTMFDPLNRCVVIPNHRGQWSGWTPNIFIYHVEMPTRDFGIVGNPGWRAQDMTGLTTPFGPGVLGNRGIWDRFRNGMCWGVSQGSDQGYENFLRLAGGPTTALTLPHLDFLLPNTRPAGGPDFALTVAGNNFTSGATINWNGAPRATSFLSSTQLVATILASDVAIPTTGAVTVTNPGPILSDNSLLFSVSNSAFVFAQLMLTRVY